MVIQIFTSVVNRPDFVSLQNKLFEKFLKDDYQFHIVDDSIDSEISNQFRSICLENKFSYYKKPERKNPMNPAQACADTVQWTYDNIILKNHLDDIVFFCDSDLFLIDEFNIEEYMSNAIIAGLPQKRGEVTYMWNGIMFFNMPKITDLDIDFSDGVVEGEMTDVGGHTYYYFKKNNIEMKKTDEEFPLYPTHFGDIEIQNDEVTKGYNFELHLDGKFLHYRAATNWHSNWRDSNDPLVKKTGIFNRIIESILFE
jgi:hypothetical protein